MSPTTFLRTHQISALRQKSCRKGNFSEHNANSANRIVENATQVQIESIRPSILALSLLDVLEAAATVGAATAAGPPAIERGL